MRRVAGGPIAAAMLAVLALTLAWGHAHARADAGSGARDIVAATAAGQADPATAVHRIAQGDPADTAAGHIEQVDPALAQALAAPGGTPPDGASASGPEWAASATPDSQAPGIPPGVFWRQIFPGMLLLLATAAGVSFGYAQLRREVMRRRAAERRLQAARDLADSAALAKSTFFATMSHEIRTPLSGIIGMLDLLKRASMGAEQRQMLVAVDTAATSLLQILDQVMDFSKVEANRMSLESIPVDLRAMIQSVVMVMGEPARRRGVKTSYEIDDAVSQEVLGDPLRIRQILTNLMSNAAKFTAQGEVKLTLTVEAGDASHQSLCFVVKDTGIGIAPEKLAQVMVPFRQADAATTRHYGGSGLGLSVSSRLAALMGGQLTLSSVPREGTRAAFTCRFPVHRPRSAGDLARGAQAPAGTSRDRLAMAASPGTAGREAATPERTQASPGAAVSPAAPRLLVVDDHAINRDLMRRQLANLGYACDALSDGPAALEALRSSNYALMLTDCQMPAMSGAELARAWREEERRRGVAPQARMPIVIVTARTDADRPGGLDIDARVRKPITLDRLRAVLTDCLPHAVRTAAPFDDGPQLPHAAQDAGLALAMLRAQFGDNETALRHFLQTSVAALRADLAEAEGMLCPPFCASFADWLHRALGALGMLGHWPVLNEGNALEEALRRMPAPDLLPEILPFLQRFAETVDDIERQVQRL